VLGHFQRRYCYDRFYGIGRLDNIECRDAILNADGTEAVWPTADVVIGNPPFLGDKFMRDRLGDEYTKTLRAIYDDRVPGGADLVCYWFAKARERITAGEVRRAGLVATNSIRGGANRFVLDQIVDELLIFDAWADEEWTVDGAAVRVSLISFDKKGDTAAIKLDGVPVSTIFADLTAGAVDLTKARGLPENNGVAFNGISKKGNFDIKGDVARSWLTLPLNPNGRPNADVVHPWINGLDVTRRPQDMWLIHFGDMPNNEAALFEAPYAWVQKHVYPERHTSNSAMERRDWWLLARRAPAMQSAINSLSRYLVTSEVAKHRVFIWVDRRVVPDKNVVVIARDDDTAFGILQSRFHVAWSLRLGTSLEDRPRYTSSTTFRTFPFPDGLTPNTLASTYVSDPCAARIATAARHLNELRNNWLNPPDLIQRKPEVVSGLPDRVLPLNDSAALTLKKRTLNNLYNERPAWLANAHADLDEAVAAAYGWPADISEDDAIARLFEFNQARAAPPQLA
jgi:type II restriction/modification system DNA methylase subunit YeeA